MFRGKQTAYEKDTKLLVKCITAFEVHIANRHGHVQFMLLNKMFCCACNMKISFVSCIIAQTKVER